MKIHLPSNTAWATLKYTIAADVMDNGKTRHTLMVADSGRQFSKSVVTAGAS
jgi:glycine cleavage system aminomethyltransferase T